MANELYHHGVLGMKWGVRRYQNTDGSYKSGAEGRYDPNGESGSSSNSSSSSKKSSSGSSESSEKKKFQLSEGQKKALKVGAAVAVTAVAAYGAYKLGSTVAQVHDGQKFFDSLSPEMQENVNRALQEKGLGVKALAKGDKSGMRGNVRRASTWEDFLAEARQERDIADEYAEAFTDHERHRAAKHVNDIHEEIAKSLGIKARIEPPEIPREAIQNKHLSDKEKEIVRRAFYGKTDVPTNVNGEIWNMFESSESHMARMNNLGKDLANHKASESAKKVTDYVVAPKKDSVSAKVVNAARNAVQNHNTAKTAASTAAKSVKESANNSKSGIDAKTVMTAAKAVSNAYSSGKRNKQATVEDFSKKAEQHKEKTNQYRQTGDAYTQELLNKNMRDLEKLNSW